MTDTTESAPDILTARDVAACLGISPRRVRALAASRGVGRRITGAWLFRPEDVERLRPQEKYRRKDPPA